VPASATIDVLRDGGSTGRAYLDHASTSPVRPAAVEAMLPWLSGADPGRVHTEGRMARVALEEGRQQVAALFGTRPRQVIFTSGATEAINAAVYGAVALARQRIQEGPRSKAAGGPGGPSGADVGPGPGHLRVALAAVEHSAVREASEREARRYAAGEQPGPGVVGPDASEWPQPDPVALESARLEPAGPAWLTRLDVDATARIRPESVSTAAVGPGLVLVHCQWANHEVGTIQPVRQIVAACRDRGILVHVDAAAAAGHVPIDFDELGADLLSVSAHKLGGPRGVGALLVRRGLRVPPLLLGGAQERARRAGMEDVAGAVGFGAAAVELAQNGRLAEEALVAAAQTERLRAVATQIPGVEVYGPGEPGARLPSLVCLGVAGVEAEAVLIGLDQAGVAAHSGSACSSELLEPSPVLAAMGVNAEQSLRLSVGWSTTAAEVELAARALPQVIERLRALAAG
jgi:cysteine desulfurase